jgi:hypothetical protein
MKNQWNYRMFFVFFVFYLLLNKDIYGYIDPGSGSYIIQILIAAMVAVSFTVKIFWRKIKQFFKQIFSKKEKNNSVEH